ncbi:AraC family transcriptional regulator [Dubosiella newyorkensis]|jgi:AraC-like DNA-binding protein|uniref:AraC family transcriptional regulator n=1 Tax=Dubosiella newyorkensis TaxID=1862672 RepID=UPI002355A766|nr:helix-turn-helix domain-containing protein [Dubosiella newyorkensis]MCI9041570.1 AraC family transcriptional regulator [Dubosiella newyorkensis]
MKEKLRTEFNQRQSMIQPDFELYYYTDTNLQSVNTHKHDYYEILFFLEGDVSTIVNGESYSLEPGDLLIVPPNVFHQTKINTTKVPYRRFTLWISTAFYQKMVHLDPSFGYWEKPVVEEKKYHYHLDNITSYNIQSKIVRLLESLHYDEFGKHAYERLCCSDVMLSINQLLYEQDHPYELKEGQSLAESLFNYIKMHIDEDISLESLAKTFYISKYYISHLFKSHVGMSVHQYIIKKRLNLVCSAILSDMEITKACEQAGFKNYSNFYRAFVKEYGVSPKEYKEKHRIEPAP